MKFTDLNDALLIVENPEHSGWQAAYDFLLYHPETRGMMLEASRVAMKQTFGFSMDELKPGAYTDKGEALYYMEEFAERIGMGVDTLKLTASQFEKETGQSLFHDGPANLVQ
jgi:hypothetical protein